MEGRKERGRKSLQFKPHSLQGWLWFYLHFLISLPEPDTPHTWVPMLRKYLEVQSSPMSIRTAQRWGKEKAGGRGYTVKSPQCFQPHVHALAPSAVCMTGPCSDAPILGCRNIYQHPSWEDHFTYLQKESFSFFPTPPPLEKSFITTKNSVRLAKLMKISRSEVKQPRFESWLCPSPVWPGQVM